MKNLFLHIILFVSVFFVASPGVHGQTTVQPKQMEYQYVGILYTGEWSIDVRLHTNGLAVAANFGKIRKYYLTRYYHIELGYLKHPKEFKQNLRIQNSVALFNSSNSFIFGKQNSLLMLRGGIGEKRYFSEKAKRKGLAVGISYEAGPSIGLLKPYYLDLIRIEDDGVTDYISSEKYSEENEDIFLNISRIFGHSGFSKGLDEVKLISGIHGKFALHFAPGAFDKYVRAIEAGLILDVYFKDVPLMAIDDNRPFFFNLYLAVQLGRRS